MAILMGPVLSFRGVTQGRWRISVLVVTDGSAPTIEADGATPGTAKALWEVEGRTAFRSDLVVKLSSTARPISYRVDGKAYVFNVPAKGFPPRLAYGSCNGFSSLRAMKGVADKNCLWRAMATQHAARPFQLLLLGGDQVYADSMWTSVEPMRKWAELDFDSANEAPASPDMKRSLRRFYFDLYVERWAQPEVAKMLASIPSIAMWDDHDLIDGWGSYPAARQQCEVFQQAIWPAAVKAFRTFQHQVADNEIHPAAIAEGLGLSLGFVVGPLAILALDMRTERSEDQILSAGHWTHIWAWTQELEDTDHLIVMSSIPVVYPGFDTLERLLGFIPGQQELEDDLRDHWNSPPHKGERLRLIHRLLLLSQQRLIRPTLISGDVHVAALGYIESSRHGSGDGAVINQLISSGIVHPGPGGAVVFALRHLFDSKDEIDRGIVCRMVDFPGTQQRFIGKRNFLTLEPDDGVRDNARLWCNWWVEGQKHPLTKVVHPLERGSPADEVRPQAIASAAAP